MEGSANLHVLLKKHAVESVCERDNRIVSHLTRLLDAYDVLCPSLLEDSADELGVASRYENELKLALVLSNHLFELLSAHQLTASSIVFEHQEITLASVLLEECYTHFKVVEDAMS